MASKVAVAAFVVIIVVGVYFLWFYQKPPPQSQQAVSLTFSVNFPTVIPAEHSVTGYVTVTNNGAAVTGVLPIVVSQAISGSVSNPVSLTTGSLYTISVTITGNDIQDGNYSVSTHLQFSSGTGTNNTSSETTWIYLLPNVQLTSIRYKSDLFHLLPPYKNTIGVSDNTSLLFKVQSMSSSVIYSGLVVTAKLNASASGSGLSIIAQSLPIEPIGPEGTTGDYAFVVVSHSTPPGMYGYVISLYSKDDQLIQQFAEVIIVRA
jgi:hypothetical protein